MLYTTIYACDTVLNIRVMLPSDPSSLHIWIIQIYVTGLIAYHRHSHIRYYKTYRFDLFYSSFKPRFFSVVSDEISAEVTLKYLILVPKATVLSFFFIIIIIIISFLCFFILFFIFILICAFIYNLFYIFLLFQIFIPFLINCYSVFLVFMSIVQVFLCRIARTFSSRSILYSTNFSRIGKHYQNPKISKLPSSNGQGITLYKLASESIIGRFGGTHPKMKTLILLL